MKRVVVPKTEKEILLTHPIASNVRGWFIRVEETSNNAFLVEAIDRYGRIVSKHGSDPDYLIVEIEKEISKLIFH